MSDGRVDKTSSYQHKASASSSQGSLSYPVRRMRNTAVLVKWIEEHQTNPYPTKAEKQYLAYYSGMNLTQLSTWFANARRRIKKIGMKTWLEGRSTFTVDFFPSSTLSRPAMPADAYAAATGGAYHTLSPASPYAYPTLTGIPNSYTAQHHSHIGLQTTSQRLNGSSSVYTDTSSMHHGASSSSINGLYGAGTHSRSLSQPMMMMHPFSNWPMASASPLLPATSVSLQSRQVGNTMPMHSPLTAQVYTADTSHLRTQSLETVSDGPYSLPQHSPDQMLPECASTEPMLQDNQKTQSSITN